MPNNISSLHGSLQRALANKIISKREANRLVREISRDGVTDAEVNELVSTLKAALDDGLDLSTSTRRRNLNRLLARVDQKHRLPLNRDVGQSGSQTLNYILALRATGSAHDAMPLPHGSFGKQSLKVGDDGSLRLGDRAISLDQSPSQASLDALLGLQRPGQLKDLDPALKSTLADRLLDGVEKNLPVPLEGAGKHKKTVAITASLSALAQLNGDLSEGQIDRLLDLYDKLPAPMAQSLLYRGIEGATLNNAQKARFEALSKPENQTELLKAWDDMNQGQARVGWDRPKGEAAQFGLSALAYAKSQTSIDNIYDGMKTYKNVNKDYSSPWDAQELDVLNKNLESYVEKYPQGAFVFGTFSSEAPKQVAQLTNARVQAAIAPALDATPPKLDGFPLSPSQADSIKTLLPGIKDEGAVADVRAALGEASKLFSTSPYGASSTSNEPLSPAAFALFQRSAAPLFQARGDRPDGMIDARGLKAQVRSSVTDIRKKLAPRLRELNGTPPRFDCVTLSAEAAGTVRGLLHNNLRSSLSVDNIAQALQAIAEQHGGVVEGDGLALFNNIVNGYKAEWPGEQFFDFNKLGRIASYKAQGKEVPLSTLNGQPIGMAQYNAKIATGVATAIDRSVLKRPWMADRWGYRARESVELLDVIAQQNAEGKGPIHTLQQKFPDKQIEVLATGLDGGHQRFVYEVSDGNRRMGRFSQGSDGAVTPYRGGFDPVLFRAQVRNDGAYDVQIPATLRIRKVPLQTSYDVGDSIDWPYKDNSVEEAWDEGKKFTTQHKILEATIQGYDSRGNYTIAYTLPDGSRKEETVRLSKIKQYNNPHLFSERSGRFSDVSINVNTDTELKKFLDGAQPIIDKYLPQDGSLANIDPGELTRRQKAVIKEIQQYVGARIKYPAHKGGHLDEASKKYWEFDEKWRFPLGELAKIGKGVCRHQCIFEQLLLQRAGIDARLASGAANTGSGTYRGLHIWSEVSLADNSRYLSDQTWSDATIPLWSGAYDRDKRRVEMYHRTARYSSVVVD